MFCISPFWYFSFPHPERSILAERIIWYYLSVNIELVHGSTKYIHYLVLPVLDLEGQDYGYKCKSKYSLECT